MIEVRDIFKSYMTGDIKVRALKGISFAIQRGDSVSIMGPSGSGKSTLMNILGCIDTPTSGSYLLDGQEVSVMDDNALASVRNKKVGFVFQTFNLLNRLTAVANVELPLIYSGMGRAERREKAMAALEKVGLSERVYHNPMELSGGQSQRVAIARALVNNPSIILADEPTGNLDQETGHDIMDLFERLNADYGVTLIIVTHDPTVGGRARRLLHLVDGMVVRDETRK